MRKELAELGYGDWRGLVLRVREATGLKTGRLALMAGVSGETWWRWETKGQRPKDPAVVDRFARAFGIEPDDAMWAAGLAIGQQVAPAPGGPDLRGLDPNDDVVKNILSLDISEEERGWMLDHRRKILALRREQDIRELELLLSRRGDNPRSEP